LQYKFLSNSIVVDCVSETGGSVVLNVLHHPFFSARIDGETADVIETADNQVSVSVPKGNHRLVLKYTDRNFIYASLVSFVCVLLFTACLWSKRVKDALVEYMS
jgi:uncharacterized membrane protein YfhO